MEQLVSLISLGDGSTLSLDFTTGVLDPRLTFTRSTNATFINSQGLVEWANSNMYWNTAFEGLSGSNPSLTSSGWGYAISTGGTAVFNGDGSVTVTTTAAERRAIFRSSGFSGGGLRVVASVDVTIASGSLQASQVIVTGTPTNAQHYVNGVIWNSFHPIWNGGILPVGTQFNIAYATDSLTSGTTSVYFGVGCTSVIAGSATFSNPRWTMWKGSATVPYYPNTSATNNSTANYFKSNDYQAPRFDHDPTTLAPRGLLIEGQVSNVVTYSGDLTQNGAGHWSSRTNLVTTNWTGFTAPDNTASAVKIIPDTTSGRHTIENNAPSIVNGTTYTASAFVKADGYTVASLVVAGGQARRNFTLTGAGSPGSQFGATNTATIDPVGTQGWYRVTMTWTATITGGAAFWIGVPQNATTDVVSSWSGNGTSAIQAWGAQLETGSGASSYIPTGASQGTRNPDECSMTGTNFSSWFTGITTGYSMLWSCSPQSRQSGSFPPMVCIRGPSDSGSRSYYYNDGTYNTAHRTSNGTTSSESFGPNSLTYGIARKFAISVTNGSQLVSSNGATANSNTQAITSFNQTILGFGNDAGSPLSSLTGRQHFQSFKFWPTALPQATLNSLTTL
jgi:hypothetical protein